MESVNIELFGLHLLSSFTTVILIVNATVLFLSMICAFPFRHYERVLRTISPED